MAISDNFYGDINLNKNRLIAAGFEVLPNAPTGPVQAQQYFDSTLNQFRGWNGTAWVDLSMTIAGATTARGEINNANTNPGYPANPQVGDSYFITTAAGTVGGTAVEIGDQLVYSQSGWFTLQRNLQQASQTISGFVRLATQAEANAGALDSVAVSPATLAQFLRNLLYARKFVGPVAGIAANTATTVTHGLGLLSPEACTVAIKQAGTDVRLQVNYTSNDAITITSNQALSGLTVVVQG